MRMHRFARAFPSFIHKDEDDDQEDTGLKGAYNQHVPVCIEAETELINPRVCMCGQTGKTCIHANIQTDRKIHAHAQTGSRIETRGMNDTICACVDRQINKSICAFTAGQINGNRTEQN